MVRFFGERYKKIIEEIHLKPAQLPEKSSSPLGPTTGVARIQRPARPQRMRITWQNCQVDLWIHMVHHPTVKYRVCIFGAEVFPMDAKWRLKTWVWSEKKCLHPNLMSSEVNCPSYLPSEGLISSTQVIEMVGWLDTLLWPRDVDLWFIIIHTEKFQWQSVPAFQHLSIYSSTCPSSNLSIYSYLWMQTN